MGSPSTVDSAEEQPVIMPTQPSSAPDDSASSARPRTPNPSPASWATLSLQQEPLGDRVAHELRVLIVSGALAPGTHLVEGPLADQFDVSRGPVRDALRRLEAEGLVESRRRGVFVKGLSAEDVDELYSLRETLEAMALRLTMRRTAEADWSVAERCVAEMRQAADAADAREFARADLEFHSQFYVLSGHRRLTAVWEQYRPTFAVMLGVTNAQDRDLHPSAQAHADLLTAIREGSAAQTELLLSEHLLGSCNRLREAMGQAARQHAAGTHP